MSLLPNRGLLDIQGLTDIMAMDSMIMATVLTWFSPMFKQSDLRYLLAQPRICNQYAYSGAAYGEGIELKFYPSLPVPLDAMYVNPATQLPWSSNGKRCDRLRRKED